MKLKRGIALLLTPLLLTGCDVFEDIFYVTVVGEGEVVTFEYESKDYEKYTTLNVSDLRMPNKRASLKVYNSTDEHKIIVKAQENIEECIKVKYLGSTVYIEGGEYEKYSTDAIEIEVYGFIFNTVKLSTIRGWLYEDTLSTSNVLIDCASASYVDAYNVKSDKVEVKASGASTVYVPLTKEDITELKCSVSGASDVRVNASTSNIANTYLNVSGASKVELNGNGNYLEASISGASKVDSTKFASNEAKVNLSGASTAAVNVNNKLRAQLSGASTLTYYTSNSNLDFTSPSVSGGSRIIKGQLSDID